MRTWFSKAGVAQAVPLWWVSPFLGRESSVWVADDRGKEVSHD